MIKQRFIREGNIIRTIQGSFKGEITKNMKDRYIVGRFRCEDDNIEFEDMEIRKDEILHES